MLEQFYKNVNFSKSLREKFKFLAKKFRKSANDYVLPISGLKE